MTTQSKGVPGPWLRHITGWALVAAAIGTFWDEIACGGCTDGSFGLVPLYLGFPIGAIGQVLIYRKLYGWLPTGILAVGLAGILYFMFAYPNGVEGWKGAILIGMAHLFLPLPWRFNAVLWALVGAPGFSGFRINVWTVIEGFILFGVATAFSGAYVLWGTRAKDESYKITTKE